jgi:hypothetical protein
LKAKTTENNKGCQMKVTKVRGVTMSVLILSGLLLVLAASCSFDKEHEQPAVEEKPIEHAPVAEQAEHEHQSEYESQGGFIANPFCYACHADFEDEKLVARHEKAGVGCERCHGESERHRSDEANITPPEIMYPRSRIIPTCMMCHPRETIKHVLEHKAILEGAETIFDEEKPQGPGKVCTDCHAENHKMNVRITRWNKATGEVLEEK